MALKKNCASDELSSFTVVLSWIWSQRKMLQNPDRVNHVYAQEKLKLMVVAFHSQIDFPLLTEFFFMLLASIVCELFKQANAAEGFDKKIKESAAFL